MSRVMKMIGRVVLAFCLLGAPNVILAASSSPAKSLLVYGDGFLFSIREPDGWVGDIQSAARYSANIVFHARNTTTTDGDGVARVTVVGKTDEDVAKDLEADKADYRKQYPTVQFEALRVSHPRYKVFASEFVVKGKYHEYVAYLNPGLGNHLMFSVAMNTQRNEATPAQLAALAQIIGSLEMLNGNKKPDGTKSVQ